MKVYSESDIPQSERQYRYTVRIEFHDRAELDRVVEFLKICQNMWPRIEPGQPYGREVIATDPQGKEQAIQLVILRGKEFS